MLTRPRAALPPTRFGGWISWRRAPVAALVVLATTGLPGSAAAPKPPPALADTVVVSGSTSSYTEVTLGQALSIPRRDAPPAVTTFGSGFVGLALVRVQRGETPPGLVVTTVPGTATPHYAWLGHARGTHALTDPPTYFTRILPPGRYRLYLFTSGATTVTWRLPLRRGRTRVLPRTRTSVRRVELTAPGVRGSVVASAYAEQLTASVTHRGLVLGLTWYDAHGRLDATLGNCTYPGPPSTGGLGPAPACLDRDVSTGPTGAATDDRFVSQGSGYLEPGTWTSKHYVRVAGAVRDGGISVLIADLGAGFPAQ